MVTKRAREAIVAEYNRQRDLYVQWTAELVSLLGKLFPTTDSIIHSITGRVKSETSLARKLLRPDKSYYSLSDITDVAGLRIIVYFSDHVNKVAEVIRDEFAVDYTRSVDKRALLDPDRFGYLSLHYIVVLNDARLQLPEYGRFRGLNAELQIRSILQHSWAEIEHDLGYKSALSIPKEIRRDFSRIASLLELADSEFVRIRSALDHYKATVGERIDQAPSDVSIDKISLVQFVEASGLVTDLDHEMAEASSVERVSHVPEWVEKYVEHFYHFGVRNISSLENALRENAYFLVEYARDRLSSRGYFQLISGVSIGYLPYALAGRNLRVEDVLDYFERFHLYLGKEEGEKKEVAALVVRIMREQEGINRNQKKPT
jgi:putative GTP pyrophosphokinase